MTVLRWRDLGTTDYVATWEAMRAFSDARDAETPDELWLTEHPPVFTQGRAGKAEHLLWPGEIPVVQTDRGGQVTYHGPGQVVAYPLLDLARRGLGVRDYVSVLEGAMLDVLADYGVAARARADAPGVYLDDGAKIGSVGVRIRRGRTTHGLALNVVNDLEPFARINPCGLVGVAVARLEDRSARSVAFEDAKMAIANALANRLGNVLVRA